MTIEDLFCEDIEYLFEPDEKCESIKVEKNILKHTDSNVVVKVYALARKVVEVLREHNVLFWTSGGTTLGLCRHGGLIPWDDDLDICMLEKDILKLGNLTRVLEEKGLEIVQSNSYVWKLYDKINSFSIEGKKVQYRYPFCDIFIMKSTKERFVLSEKEGQIAWPHEWYSQEQIENISWRQFADFSLPCPGDPESYLCRTYGDDWSRVGATQALSHNSRHILLPQQFTLDTQHYQPAMPFK